MKRKLLITLCILFGLAGIAAASAAWWYHHNFNAAPFKPVQLSAEETKVLNEKLDAPKAPAPDKTITLSEREINGWLEQQGLGDKIKVSIGDGTISAASLLPLDKEVPFLGGRTVRFKISLRPQINASHHLGLVISDVTIGGISPPNAWLGGIKGVDLLAENSTDPAVTNFLKGIKSFELNSGEVRVLLND